MIVRPSESAERQVPMIGHPLGSQPVVLASAGLAAVGAKVEVAAVQRDDGVAAGLVAAVLGRAN